MHVSASKHGCFIYTPNLILLLSLYLFSFSSWVFKQSCSVWGAEQLSLLEHLLILFLSCSKGWNKLLLVYETFMFHLSVSTALPPPPCRPPLGHRRSHTLSHTAARHRLGEQVLDISKPPITPSSTWATERHLLPFPVYPTPLPPRRARQSHSPPSLHRL
jgi:hypothetical protein